MSDFLSHLAERALALPPVVRPRLASVYESPPGGSGFEEPLEQHLEAPAQKPAALEFARKRRVQARTDEPASKLEERPATPPVGALPAPSIKILPDDTPELPARFAAERKAPDEAVPPQAKVPPHQIAAGDERQSRDHWSKTPAKQPISAVGEATNARTPVSSSKEEAETHRPSVATKPEMPPPFSKPLRSDREKKAVHPTPVTVQAVSRQREEKVAHTGTLSAPREKAPRAPAPSVQVTIGRVEIRAVMPPVPEPRPAPAASPGRLSLDEYLKRKDGASR